VGEKLNKSDIEGMIELIEKDPVLKQKFSKLMTSIMDEDAALKSKFADIIAREMRRRKENFG
jgi:hypothetical protein